jgi:hypothetical protein
MSSRREAIRQEHGVVMVLVVFVTALLASLSLLLINHVTDEVHRSGQAVSESKAFQAAEAGVDDYIAKLLDDRLYYAHVVHPGEATRRDTPSGTLVSGGTSGVTWSYSLVWAYPNGFDHWRAVGNGYEYSLEITPPDAGSQVIKIVSTGRKLNSSTGQRTIEIRIRPSSLADFQRVVNGDVSWGVGATTNGKLYAAGTITHDGTAAADIYAEEQIVGSTTLTNGAIKYDSDSNPTIRTVIKNPINFSALLASLVDIQRASSVAGVYLDDATKAAWRLVFAADGTFTAQKCTKTSGNEVEDVAATCGTATSYNVPANGAVYTAQTAIVSGVVDGRVTVGSNDDIVVADNISYETIGDDVLGLVAKNDVWGAAYAPTNLTWRAGVIAQSGTWKGAGPNGTKNTMTWYGSSTTQDGGSWTMFNTRVYSYDTSLLYLPPPWFPVIEDAYTVILFRELPAN